MYNIMGIWPIYQKLLSAKPIATLRQANEKKIWKTTDGETKE